MLISQLPLQKKQKQSEVKIHLSELFNIPPRKIFLHLVKFVGEDIKKGDIVAEKKSMLGKKQYVSQHDGTIKEIDHENGWLVITERIQTADSMNAYFKGKIEEIKKNEISLQVKNSRAFSLKEASSDFGGEVFFADEIDVSHLNEDEVDNKVVLTSTVDPYIQTKLEAMGTAGLVLLNPSKDKPSIPFAFIKEKGDWDSIKKSDFPCCIVDKKNTKMFFYQS